MIFFQALTADVKKPPTLVKLAATRWLSWYGAVKSHLVQYSTLESLFQKVVREDRRKDHPMAHTLVELHADKSHLLYLTFLKPLLHELTSMNVVFQSSIADVAKVYKDLRDFVFTMAKKIIKPERLKESRPGMLRTSELEALRSAIQSKDAHLPVNMVGFGEGFWSTQATLAKLPHMKFEEVQAVCADFLIKFVHELTSRLPTCIDAVQKMRAFTPAVALATRGRPGFRDLPHDLVRKYSFGSFRWLLDVLSPSVMFSPRR